MTDRKFKQVGALAAPVIDAENWGNDHLTAQSADILKALNASGFLTTNSQIGCDETYTRSRGRWKQRAYMTALCHHDHERALRDLGMTTDLIIHVVRPVSDDSGNDYRPPVTVHQPPGSPWQEFTWFHVSTDWDYEVEMLFARKDVTPRDSDLMRRHGIMVHAFDPVWGRPQYLHQKLLEAVAA